jgi:hypothetical protein
MLIPVVFLFLPYPPVSDSMTSEMVYAVQLAAAFTVQKTARASPGYLGRARAHASPRYGLYAKKST